MGIYMTEALQNIETLRKAAVAQQEAYDNGKSEEKPKVAPQTFDMMEKMVRNISGDFSKGRASIRETITSTDTVSLIPRVIEGQLREAAEPEYLATRFMNVINVEGGNNSTVYVVPIVGEVTAHEVGEDGRYNEDTPEFNTLENAQLEVRVKKIGLKVRITEEAISDSSWDILGINIRKMGTAMAR
jgi:HK97 family phage major capsid protein